MFRKKFIALLIVIGLFIFPVFPQAQIAFDGPESVSFDSMTNCYFISNYNDGSIVRIDNYDDSSYFKTGLGHCYGNCIKNNMLYVTTGNQFKGFDINTGEEVYDIYIALPSRNLDGCTYDTSGYFYAVCTGGVLYRIDLSDQSYEVLVNGGFPNHPQDIIFDKFNNRILVASYASGSPIKQVSLPDGTMTTATETPTGIFDGISIDNEGYVYLSSNYTPGMVIRYNNDFTVGPEVIASGFSLPSGLDYNLRDDIIAVPVFNSNRVDFIHMYLDFEADTLWGYAPFEVTFTGSPGVMTASQELIWSWAFGDGETGTSATTTHTYLNAGAYNVTATVELPDESTRSYTRYSYIFVLADTLYGEDTEISTDTFEIPVNITNTMPLKSLVVPCEFAGDMELHYLGYSTESCRNEEYTEVSVVDYDETNKTLTLNLDAGTGYYFQTGSGPVVKLKFEMLNDGSGEVNQLFFDGYNTYTPTFDGVVGDYTPEVLPISLTFIEAGCCIGVTGDADCSGGEPDISDITRLIDFLYISHNLLCCAEEADVDASGGEPDISDITFLIDHLYLSHKVLPDCP